MAIRFKLDENIPSDAEESLRQAGRDVHSVLAEHLGGNLDCRVFDAYQAAARVR